jgi:hypothetical protein
LTHAIATLALRPPVWIVPMKPAFGLRESADGCHVKSPFDYLSRAYRSLDGRLKAGSAPAAPLGRNQEEERRRAPLPAIRRQGG